MFDDLKIRNKLVLLVAGPMAIIVLLASLGAQSRLSTARDAEDVTILVRATNRSADVIDALQAETLYSAGFVASGRKNWAEELQAARTTTDQAVEAARKSLNKDLHSFSSGLASTASMATTTLDRIAAVRTVVDQGYSWYQTIDSYQTIEAAFLRVNATIASSTSDAEVADELRTVNALATRKQALALQGALLVGAITSGSYGADGLAAMEAAMVDEQNQQAILSSVADTASKGKIRDALTGDDWTAFDLARLASVEGAKASTKVGGDANATEKQIHTVLDRLHGVETDKLSTLASNASTRSTRASRAATIFLGAAFLAVVLAAGAAVVLGRRITRPLARLTDAADRLSNEQMPRLVESLRNPALDEVDYRVSYLEDIKVDSKDEIGRLAQAFNNVQKVTGDVATEQAATLRKGIGDMFVNLARRNQALLDRQIEFIDELERSEEDADSLENLYKLDHMATRMRRNAESLLVLAGAEPPRRRGRPAPFANVVRAALAEVEDFGRIKLRSLDEVFVASNASSDVAHLLSELMENATNFSPPDTQVEIAGNRTASDGYLISITDHGIGMSNDQIEESNRTLARPPHVGLALSRSLGFTVVGRLALRHKIGVRVMSAPNGGVVALVTLPPALITDAPGAARPGHRRASDVSDGPTGPVRSTSGGPRRREAPAPVEPAAEAVPARRTESTGLPPAATFAPPGESTPERATPAKTAPQPAAAAVGGAEPLLFQPAETRTGAASTAEPVGTTDTTQGALPTRRLVAQPAPGREADEAKPRRNLRVPFDPPLVAEDDAAPVPAVVGAESTEASSRFLEEKEPPRLFGARPEATPPAPAAAAAAPPTPATPPASTRLFGRTDPPPAPAAEPASAATPAPLPEALPEALPSAPAAAVDAAPTVLDRRPPRAPGRDESTEPAASALPSRNGGLARRTPRAASSRPIPGAEGERGVSASKRSPDEVRNLLSRYRDGQKRARTEPAEGPEMENP